MLFEQRAGEADPPEVSYPQSRGLQPPEDFPGYTPFQSVGLDEHQCFFGVIHALGPGRLARLIAAHCRMAFPARKLS